MATSIIKLHTFSGSSNPCYILQVDEFHCLLDCGWHENLKSESIKKLSQWARCIDAVLLSHQSLRHIGLIPYLVGSCGLKCPIYATTPVCKMGQLELYDFFQSRYASEDFSAFTLDDVDAAFELVVQIKYHQSLNLHGRGHGICITALPSGHTLGGTIWKLVKEDTDIVYAMDFNHKKERHLNGATFDACMRPHLLILDASNAVYAHLRRKERDENLKQSILRTLRRGGNVLIAVDTAGRVLEIANFLEQCWLNQDSGMMAYGLAMLNHVAFNVVDFARSMVEWMSEKVMRAFEDQRSNPFHFRHMQLCHSLEQLDAVPEPKVVLASASDLNYGFSAQLFAEWADSDLNTVILTSRDCVRVLNEHSNQHTQSESTDTTQNIPLLSRLISLARGDAASRDGLATSSTGTLMLPFSLSQRVSAAQADQLEHELPQLRNAIQPHSTTTSDAPSGTVSSLDSDRFPVEAETVESLPQTAAFSPLGLDENEDPATVSTSSNLTSSDVDLGTLVNPSVSRVSSSGTFDDGSARTTENDHTLQPVSTFRLATSTILTDRNNNPDTRDLSASTRPRTLSKSDADVTAAIPLTTSHLTSGRHLPGYDIYPGIQNHAGGQFFRMAKRTQLLFPQCDKKVHWDEYGGHLDPSLFSGTGDSDSTNTAIDNKLKVLNSSSLPATTILSDPTAIGFTPKSIIDYLSTQTCGFGDPEMKTRCVTHQLEIPLRCELLFLDYEGRSDGEAMKRIVVGVRPQEIILVGTNRKAIDHLAGYCQSVQLLDSRLIHRPGALEVINCTKEGDIYQARMKDSLVSSLRFTKIRDYELAWIDAVVSLQERTSSNANWLPNNGTEGEDVDMLSLGNGPDELSTLAAEQLPVLNPPIGSIGQHKTVFVNEPKLSDLKQLLLNQGLMAEFVSGVLVIDNCVAIKRSEAGKLVLEGLLSRTYFDVRQILYQQFAIL